MISYILNNAKEAKFLLYDVSDFPTSTGTAFTIEALYKMALIRMEDDFHTFPIADFDKIIIEKCKQLLAEGQEGQENRALLAHTKVKNLVDNKVQNKVGTIKASLNFAPSSYIGLFDT